MAHRLESLAARRASVPVVLTVLIAASLAARVGWLGQPCRSPCRSSTDRVLIFDEAYYVNAARVIAGIRPPAGSPYATSPLGTDPNSEHPQLAKLMIAGAIKLLGDGPAAWRLPSVALGTLAILGLFVLVAAAGGGPWLAVGAAALMAGDNLALVHGRIGTLDVYAVCAMIWGAALYLRRRPLLAGAVIGVGACAKLVALYALLVLALLEAGRLVVDLTLSSSPRAVLARGFQALLGCAACCAVTLFVLLALLDRLAPPYDAAAGTRVRGGPLGHLGHMFSYAAHQTSPHGPRGIASYPWQWLGDYKPITYLNVNPSRPADGLYNVHPAVHFLGVISPPILLLALPALVFAAWEVIRRARAASTRGAENAHVVADALPLLALAWFVGTFVPFELLSLIWNRTSYLYYMLIVMPAIYIAVAYLIARNSRRRSLTWLWVGMVAAAVIVMYPLTPLP